LLRLERGTPKQFSVRNAEMSLDASVVEKSYKRAELEILSARYAWIFSWIGNVLGVRERRQFFLGVVLSA
jgi:hypothetical protein